MSIGPDDQAKSRQWDEAREPASVRERYARRMPRDYRYSLSNPSALLALQERQRAMLSLFNRLGWNDLSTRTLVEVGCGSGNNLVECLLIGFEPRNLAGIELLPERYLAARSRLPAAVVLVEGDALASLPTMASVDIVFQATVFSSLLDNTFQGLLAEAMWAAVKPGGGVLWYDFTVDNPRNKDVRGVSLARVQTLFPHARIQTTRLTLAPPLARAVTRLHPSLYTLFNVLPALRTHVLCWIAKD